MSEIKDIIIKNKFVYNKQFGQNFITDTNLLMSIVNDSEINSETTVLEIGAGAGSLTREIAKVAKKVVAFEIDKKLIPILDESLKDYDNITLITEDIMKYSDSKLKRVNWSKI